LNDKIRVEERSQESIATQKQQYKKRWTDQFMVKSLGNSIHFS
jgi:hypothetical protein